MEKTQLLERLAQLLSLRTASEPELRPSRPAITPPPPSESMPELRLPRAPRTGFERRPWF